MDDLLVRGHAHHVPVPAFSYRYLIANGTTPDDPTWVWRKVPFASSDGGALRYRGATGIDHYQYGCSFGPAPYRDMRCFVGHGKFQAAEPALPH